MLLQSLFIMSLSTAFSLGIFSVAYFLQVIGIISVKVFYMFLTFLVTTGVVIMVFAVVTSLNGYPLSSEDILGIFGISLVLGSTSVVFII